MGASALLASYGVPQIAVDSAQFDGTNDFMKTGAGLSGAADSKSGVFSCWLRIDGGDGTNLAVLQGATAPGGGVVRFSVLRLTGNVIRVLGSSAAGAVILSIQTVNTYLASATWLNVLASWDLLAGVSHLYINDVSDKTVTVLTNATLDYTLGDWSIGAVPDGTLKLNGCLAEVFFAPGSFIDFSVVGNRRKFISAGGKPIYIGSDGSLPLGVVPKIYQHLADGEAVANFATNRGGGGNFAITGTLTTGSTSPSD